MVKGKLQSKHSLQFLSDIQYCLSARVLAGTAPVPVATRLSRCAPLLLVAALSSTDDGDVTGVEADGAEAGPLAGGFEPGKAVPRPAPLTTEAPPLLLPMFALFGGKVLASVVVDGDGPEANPLPRPTPVADDGATVGLAVVTTGGVAAVEDGTGG
jgi:hypothetical protein